MNATWTYKIHDSHCFLLSIETEHQKLHARDYFNVHDSRRFPSLLEMIANVYRMGMYSKGEDEGEELEDKGNGDVEAEKIFCFLYCCCYRLWLGRFS